MDKRLIFILGGARSGKSSHAEQLAAQLSPTGRVLYVATAQAWDDEMAVRIANHQAQRPAGWRTLEAPRDVGAAITRAAAPPQVLLLDCLTLLANNVIAPMPEPLDARDAEDALRAEVDALLAAYAAGSASWIIVSNEVGLGIVPAYPLGRVYRDALGRANQQIAAVADEVLFMVAGLPLRVK